MKNLLTLIIGLTCLLPAIAQQDPLGGFASKYRRLPEVTTFRLGGLPLRLIAELVNEEDELALRLLRQLDRVRIVHVDDGYNRVPAADIDHLRRDAYERGYADYVKVFDQGEEVDVLAYEKGDTILGMLIIVRSADDGDFTALSFLGHLTYEELQRSGLLDGTRL